MENEILMEFHNVSKTFHQQFHSPSIYARNQRYLQYLDEQLNQWKTQAIQQIESLVQQKSNEIKQLYQKYYLEINVQYSTIHEQIEAKNFTLDLHDQMEYLRIYSYLNAFEKRLRLTSTSLAPKQLNDLIKLDYSHYRELTTATTILPLKEMIRKKLAALVLARPSLMPRALEDTKTLLTPPPALAPVPIPTPALPTKFWVLQAIPSVRSDDSSSSECSSADQSSASTARAHSLIDTIAVPVLIAKNSEMACVNEKFTEYVIDSLLLPELNHRVPSSEHNDNRTLVQSYKSLVSNETSYRPFMSNGDYSSSSSSSVKHVNHSTIMLTQFESEYNCLASSTVCNELLLYNSRLNTLMIIQYEESKQHCVQRTYLQWPLHLSTRLTDMTYCQASDQYLISTGDSSHLYVFSREASSVTDLGSLSDNLPLNRIHYHDKALYSIFGDRHLIEYSFDERTLQIRMNRKIELFHYNEFLLDITCDDYRLLVVYKQKNGEVHLRSFNRITLDLQRELSLDHEPLIHRNSIRIQPTMFKGRFLYLNSLRKCIKMIDLSPYMDGSMVSVIQKSISPTNMCLLMDNRLAVLYERPYFLSVYDYLELY